MSHPPEYPGRQRFKRVAAAAGSDAYQGAFEAIGAILVGGGFGYWADLSWGTEPWGLLIGLALGFAAMVLRLLRLGKELEFEAGSGETNTSGPDVSDDLGIGEAPGLSDVLRSEDADDTASMSGSKMSGNKQNNENATHPARSIKPSTKPSTTGEKIDER